MGFSNIPVFHYSNGAKGYEQILKGGDYGKVF
jgi:hypothetical protein